MTLAGLRHRSTEPEQLDQGVPEAEALASLRDLRFVNRWLGNPRSVREAIRPHLPPGGRILDVGSASGDLLADLLAGQDAAALATGLDIKPLHLRYAPRRVRRVVADARALPFSAGSFDVVTASLFLHHFDAEALPAVLAGLFGVARRALVVSDLRRSAVPYLFGRACFRLLFRSRVSVEDGLVSIRRGFTEPELRAAFASAGLPAPRLSRHFPYRLLAVCTKPAAA